MNTQLIKRSVSSLVGPAQFNWAGRSGKLAERHPIKCLHRHRLMRNFYSDEPQWVNCTADKASPCGTLQSAPGDRCALKCSSWQQAPWNATLLQVEKNPVSRHQIGHRVSPNAKISPAQNAPETRPVVTGRHGNCLDGFFSPFLPFVFLIRSLHWHKLPEWTWLAFRCAIYPSFKLLSKQKWRQNHWPRFRSSIGAGGRRAAMYFDEHLHTSVVLQVRGR